MYSNKNVKYIFSFFVFMVINIPSLKLLYSSELINVISSLGLVVCSVYLYREDQASVLIKYTSHKKPIVYFIVMWLLLFATTLIFKPTNFTITLFIKYILIIINTLLIILFAYKYHTKIIVFYQLIWATALSLFHLTIGIELDPSLRQNYLILALPIGSGVVIGLLIFLYVKADIWLKFFSLLAFFICLFAISGLNGRLSILLSVLIPVGISLFKIFSSGSKSLKFKRVVILILVLLLITYIMYINLNQYTLNRLARLTNIQDEPRFQVYVRALEAIRDNWFGVGLNGFSKFDFNYPHNIILETLLAGGLQSLVFFIIYFKEVFSRIPISLGKSDSSMILVGLFLFYFLTWNISFSLSAAYIPYALSALVITSESQQRKMN